MSMEFDISISASVKISSHQLY